MNNVDAWHDLRINIDRLKIDVEALSQIGRSEQGALTRHSYSPEYEKARNWLTKRLATSDITVRDDEVGNTFGRIGPDNQSCVMSGSHLDTVFDGGPLDGAYGLLAAVEVARILTENGLELPRAYECVAFIEEEGWYFYCLGSKAIAGTVNDKDLNEAKDPNGVTLVETMKAAGFNPDLVANATRDNNSIDAFVELHIEQGPVLESIQMPVGNVETIIGTCNTWFTFVGEPNHAGTTPMNLRKDALVGAVEFIQRARSAVMEQGNANTTRITHGIIQSEPQTANVIPSRVRLHQEIREVSDELKKQLVHKTKEIAEQVAKDYGLEFECVDSPSNDAIRMSETVRSAISDAAESLNIKTHDMPSGAVHDAQYIARIAPAGMIFVPSNGGRSHRRDEWTDWHHLENGANVLLQSVLRLIYQ